MRVWRDVKILEKGDFYDQTLDYALGVEGMICGTDLLEHHGDYHAVSEMPESLIIPRLFLEMSSRAGTNTNLPPPFGYWMEYDDVVTELPYVAEVPWRDRVLLGYEGKTAVFYFSYYANICCWKGTDKIVYVADGRRVDAHVHTSDSIYVYEGIVPLRRVGHDHHAAMRIGFINQPILRVSRYPLGTTDFTEDAKIDLALPPIHNPDAHPHYGPFLYRKWNTHAGPIETDWLDSNLMGESLIAIRDYLW